MLRADVKLPAPPTHLGFQRNKRAAPRGSPLLGEACGPSSGSVLTVAEGRGRIERDPWLRGRKPSAPPEDCQAGRAGPVSCLGVMAVCTTSSDLQRRLHVATRRDQAHQQPVRAHPRTFRLPINSRRRQATTTSASGAPLCQGGSFPPVDGAPVLAGIKQTALDPGCGSAR